MSTLFNPIFLLDPKSLPSIIELCFLYKKLEINQKMEAKKEAKSEIKAASEEFSEDRCGATSNGVAEVINNVEGDLESVAFLAKGKKTQEAIDYAMYYCSNPEAKLIEIDNTSKPLVNTICKLYGIPVPYKNVPVISLEKYDPKYNLNYNISAKYLLSVDDIKKKLSDEEFMSKVVARKAQLKEIEKQQKVEENEAVTTDNTVDNSSEPVTKEEEDPKDIPLDTQLKPTWKEGSDGRMHLKFVPIEEIEKPEESISDNTENNIADEEIKNYFIDKRGRVPENLYNKLEEAFNPYLKERYYSYSLMENGFVTLLTVNLDGKLVPYTIEAEGSILGKGEMCIVGTIGNNQRIFIPVTEEFKDVVKNVLDNAFHQFTADELQRMYDHYFRNTNIYRYVDMSNTESLKDLPEVLFQKLGKKLTFILNFMRSKDPTAYDLPRLRFDNFKSIDEFDLVSDYQAKSQMIITNESSAIVADGLRISVRGDEITHVFNGAVDNLKIENYAAL